MRIFKTPGWLQPMTCICGGEVILQPWNNFVGDHDIGSGPGVRHSIIGLNFICMGECKRQFRDSQSDWGHLVNDEQYEKLYQERIIKKE